MRKSTLLVVLVLCLCTMLHAQTGTLLQPNPVGVNASSLNIRSNTSEITIVGKLITKTLEVDLPDGGYYYVNVWLDGVDIKNNSILEVSLNDQKEESAQIKIAQYSWHSIKLGNARKYKFKKGVNKISFTSKGPHVPAVDFVDISSFDQSISQAAYSNYVNKLSKTTIGKNYTRVKKQTEDSEFSARVLPNPQGNYEHEIDLELNYSYYTTVYLQAGQPVTFSTINSNTDPVLHLFHTEPGKGSWMDDDSNGSLNSKITCTPSYTGTYILLIRKYRTAPRGIADIYKNGSAFALRVTVNGNVILSQSRTGDLNYFTSHTTGNPILWVCDPRGGDLGNVRAYNNDYRGTGDFQWGSNSRVKGYFSQPVGGVIVMAYTASNPTGICDVYMGCRNGSGFILGFPYLKADDAIVTAPATEAYNCYSWAGGRVDLGEFSPVHPSSSYNLNPWYNENDFIAWDNYFGNNPPRYSGAPNYTRSGADENNGEIALWAYDFGDIEWTHASVRKSANNMPHGYAWESKAGRYERFMHPKDGVGGFQPFQGYGEIHTYYRYAGTNSAGRLAQSLTLEESISRGLTTIDADKFTDAETGKLNSLIDNVPSNIKDEFNTKYDAWKAFTDKPEMKGFNNISSFIQAKEYKDLIAFCKTRVTSVLPLLISKVEQGKEIARQPLTELSSRDYGNLMISLRESSRKKSMESHQQQNATGKVYVAPSLTANWTRFNRLLLNELDQNTMETYSPCGTELNTAVLLCQNYPNPFHKNTEINFGLPDNTKVSLKIFNTSGQLVNILISDKVLDKGWHTATWNSQDTNGKMVEQGIYIYCLEANGQLKSGKLLKVQ